MNVVVEPQPNCLVTLRVELPSDQVSKEWSNVARNFQRKVRVPGYRPGKAPQALVENRFAKDIKEELTSRLLRESLDEAIRENNLRVLSDLGLAVSEDLYTNEILDEVYADGIELYSA